MHLSARYKVTQSRLRHLNKEINVDSLRVGDKIFIPKKSAAVIPAHRPRGTTLNIPVKVPYKPWKYIILHHSATHVGSADRFNKAHKRRGWRGIGYDFVINNGTDQKDGKIEVTPRWTLQQKGAHCSAGPMNEEGIGICLVGDFSKTSPSQAQLRSLITLVKYLKKKFKISNSRIMGHGDVRGASTECPGRNFPMKQLKKHF